jgi:hypothetical protein
MVWTFGCDCLLKLKRINDSSCEQTCLKGLYEHKQVQIVEIFGKTLRIDMGTMLDKHSNEWLFNIVRGLVSSTISTGLMEAAFLKGFNFWVNFNYDYLTLYGGWYLILWGGLNLTYCFYWFILIIIFEWILMIIFARCIWIILTPHLYY